VRAAENEVPDDFGPELTSLVRWGITQRKVQTQGKQIFALQYYKLLIMLD
jgi:hypothetical protein